MIRKLDMVIERVKGTSLDESVKRLKRYEANTCKHCTAAYCGKCNMDAVVSSTMAVLEIMFNEAVGS